MIVSHKNKFIFFKPVKTAGTTIEESIRRLSGLGLNDVYTGLTHDGDVLDGNDYSQNKEIQSGTIQEHTSPRIARELFPEEFTSYRHYSMVRNPFDLMVSYYWYCYNHEGRTELSRLKDVCAPEPGEPFALTKMKFRSFLTIPDHYAILYDQKKFEPLLPSDSLAAINGEMAMVENIIRFESLEEDLWTHFGYDKSFPLPRFKSGFRRIQRPYQDYYGHSRELIDLVGNSFQKMLERFDYSFRAL